MKRDWGDDGKCEKGGRCCVSGKEGGWEKTSQIKVINKFAELKTGDV
jgi:hypothetical protein